MQFHDRNVLNQDDREVADNTIVCGDLMVTLALAKAAKSFNFTGHAYSIGYPTHIRWLSYIVSFLTSSGVA